MLDTRHYDRDITDLYYNKLYIDSISGNEDRTIMGYAQEQCMFFVVLSVSQVRLVINRYYRVIRYSESLERAQSALADHRTTGRFHEHRLDQLE